LTTAEKTSRSLAIPGGWPQVAACGAVPSDPEGAFTPGTAAVQAGGDWGTRPPGGGEETPPAGGPPPTAETVAKVRKEEVSIKRLAAGSTSNLK
jgi:hypothetical protein